MRFPSLWRIDAKGLNLLGIFPIQRQHPGRAPIIEVVQIIHPGVYIPALRPLQIQIVGHKGRRKNGAGAVAANGRYPTLQMHDGILTPWMLGLLLNVRQG